MPHYFDGKSRESGCPGDLKPVREPQRLSLSHRLDKLLRPGKWDNKRFQVYTCETCGMVKRFAITSKQFLPAP